MAYIYNADIWCESCGRAIKDRISDDPNLSAEDAARFKGREDGFDSDEFPKYASGDEETDSPQHCGSGADCLECEVLPNGVKIGKLIGTSLTAEGVAYVRQCVLDAADNGDDSEVSAFWQEAFSEQLEGLDLDLACNEYASFNSTLCSLA